MIYGTASYYAHLRFEPPTATGQAAAVDAHRPSETTYLAALGGARGRRHPTSAERRGLMAVRLTTPAALADDPAGARQGRGPD